MTRLPITNRRWKRMRNFQIMSAMLMTFIVVFMMWYHVTLVYLYNVRRTIKSKEEKKKREYSGYLESLEKVIFIV